jgi:hypothetical protein
VYKNYGGCVNEFFCALTKRKWRRYFRAQLGVSHQRNSTENAQIECSDSSFDNTITYDVSLYYSESSSQAQWAV